MVIIVMTAASVASPVGRVTGDVRIELVDRVLVSLQILFAYGVEDIFAFPGIPVWLKKQVTR